LRRHVEHRRSWLSEWALDPALRGRIAKNDVPLDLMTTSHADIALSVTRSWADIPSKMFATYNVQAQKIDYKRVRLNKTDKIEICRQLVV
jgi:hypothetical protein